MSMIEQELRSQPDTWVVAGELAETVRDVLPDHGARVAMVGCGTSLYMAQAAACWREAASRGETDAFPASELPGDRKYDVVVAISRSGTTTEVLDVLNRVGDPTLLITADRHQPAAALSTDTVELSFADERSVVQTRFATSFLALWRAHLGEDVELMAKEARRALDGGVPVDLLSFQQFVFLGRGAAAGLAAEAALKLREAAGCWTEAYPSMEVRHGPISAVGPHTLVWSLDRLDPALRGEIEATGARVEDGTRDPMVELVRVQRLAVELAASKGLDPDHPRHLSRSVILRDPIAP
jgi:fructoselysine-6-P-deglycase FrlB-like protein